MGDSGSTAKRTYICPQLPIATKLSLPLWSMLSNISSSTSSTSLMPTRPPRTSLMYTLPLRRLREIMGHVVPSSTLESVEDLPSTRLPRLYTMNFSDDKHLTLSVAPSLSTRLLRQEQTLLSSEAILIHFLEGAFRPSTISDSLPSPPKEGSPGLIISGVVPRLLKHSSNSREIGYPYSMLDVGAGVPLATVSIYLSLPEQRVIDKQIGALVRDLALVTSPSGNFGTVIRVCEDPFVPTSAVGPSLTRGSSSWLTAFMSLVEGILRDGEDMSVLLPYEVIRAHFGRLSWRLDAVTTPRLVILDAGDASNVMIKGDTEDIGSSVPEDIKLTGLRDWSQGLFGDPLLSSCFDAPSESFMEGWQPKGSNVLIEDKEGTRARLLLYRCYRAVVDIVTEYYRPQADSSRRELEGRRKLTSTLTELDSVDREHSEAAKRARSTTRSSDANDTSKRQRTEEA